jgi:peptidoglycan L-alanyl-D-glutamate endopeptidase CwlK
MLTGRDRTRLEGVHPDLVRVITAAAELPVVPFIVIEGLRSLARQKELVDAGRSRTMASRHLTGHAVDLGVKGRVGEIRWDPPAYRALATHIKQVAKKESVEIEWGGDWKTFFDGPHFQLPRSKYPS